VGQGALLYENEKKNQFSFRAQGIQKSYQDVKIH
jgi:hypothetical protein